MRGLLGLVLAVLWELAGGEVGPPALGDSTRHLAGVVTLTSTAFRPAQAAALPSLARTPDELTAANVASSTIATLSSFVGPAAGGLLFAVTSTEVVFLLTAGVFLWSALLIARIRLEKSSVARRRAKVSPRVRLQASERS
jgi:predicted MFS family arabinose efflux permease